MNRILVASLANLYSKLLSLYPRKFRAEFTEEMQTVFRDSLEEALNNRIFAVVLLCLREFGGLPFSIFKEFWHEFRGKELIMLNENTPGTPATTGQVIMGALPFFLFGIFMIMLELPITLFEQSLFISAGGILFGSLLILPAIGFGIGWVQKFPRWSYPYVGLAVIWAFYIQSVSTPGINLFGIPIFGQEMWGWRAWVPLAVVLIIALVNSRSIKPFAAFFVNIWNDWTIPSYLMAGALPLLVMIAFDEIDRMYSLYFMLVFAALLVGTIVLYLRSQTIRQRVLVLTVGFVAILFPAGLGSNSYWLANHGTFTLNAEILIQTGRVALVMLLPAWLELLRRSMGRWRLA